MDERLTSETLDNLVTQFSSAWDFLRELVQNSIDAGSGSIEVWTDFEIEEGQSEGVISIHVDDFGAGMTEEIIDEQLTQLFSSAKENDLTKIGKFGIGFVSVFALQPKGVLVHTGRGGECWEVFFHEDLSFTKTRIEGPVEGTQLTLFLQGDRARYAEVVERVESTLRHWCRHSETEISFEDRGRGGEYLRINEDFAIDGTLQQASTNGELELVMSYSRRPSYGFYNRGLALAVGHDADDMLGEYSTRFRHIAFKIKSPWLEHTLSRETVMRDEHFVQAMTVAIFEADRKLHQALLEELAQLAGAEAWDLDEQARYAELLAFMAREPERLLLDEDTATHPIFRGLTGGTHSLDALYETYKADGRIMAAREPTALSQLLTRHGHPVLLEVSDPTGAAVVASIVGRYVRTRRAREIKQRLLRRWGMFDELGDDLVVTPESCARAVDRNLRPSGALSALLDEVRAALWKAGHKVARISAGEIEAGPEGVPLFVVGDELAPVMLTAPRRRKLLARLRGREVVVDHRHPHLSAILEHYQRFPSLAVACLAKALCLHDFAPEADDGAIFAAAREVVKGGAR